MGDRINGVMYLSGGGNWDVTKAIDLHFLKNNSLRRILFIPIAKTTNLAGYRESYCWLANKIKNLTDNPIDIVMMLDLNTCKDIDSYSAIYIGGGNTYKLLDTMNKSGFSYLLKKYVNSGGIVYGASAGAVLMGKDISTYIEGKYLKENKVNNYTFSRGLSLIGDYSVLTHYEEGDEAKVKKYFRKHSNPIIAIPAGVALVVRDNIIVVGNKPIKIFEKGKFPRIIKTGEMVSLKN